MVSPAPKPPKKIAGKLRRASRPKSRKGCATCKIRHVKCDEVRPSCGPCTSTRRTCDGYERTPSPEQGASAMPRRRAAARGSLVLRKPSDRLHGTSQEYRYLEYFRLHAAPVLSGAYDSDFWTTLVLQISEAEPAILHAVAAIGLCHQRQEAIVRAYPLKGADQAIVEHSGQAFALQQYNKAIRSLVERRSNRASSIAEPEIALVSCLLFVCIECMRGREDLAISHIHAGLNILSTLRKQEAIDEVPDSEATSMSIGRQVVPLFRRLNIQAMMFGNPSCDLFSQQGSFPSYIMSVPTVFESCSDAGKSLLLLMNASLVLFNIAGVHRYSSPPLDSLVIEQQRLLAWLDNWHGAFEAFVAFPKQQLTQAHQREAKILRMNHRLLSIFIVAWLAPSEMAFDQYTADFQNIISLAEEVGSADQELKGQSPIFSFEMGAIAPLYLTIIKCRDPTVRRQALSCLKKLHCREGLWNTRTHTAIAEKVIEYEESVAPPLLLEHSSSNGLPPASSRIHDVRIFRPGPSNSGVINVIFRFSPGDATREHRLDDQEVDLSSSPSSSASPPADSDRPNSLPPPSPELNRDFDLFTAATLIRFFRASEMGYAFTSREVSHLDHEIILKHSAPVQPTAERCSSESSSTVAGATMSMSLSPNDWGLGIYAC